jgi:site-specific DNA-cytosine methylase
MEFIDLFCGAGLFSEGMEQAGHQAIKGYDIWNLAVKSYRANHRGGALAVDILKYPLEQFPNVDLIIGSPPCQDFSLANNRRNFDTTLIKRFFEIIDYIKPKYWIMEEVPEVAKYIPKNINKMFYIAAHFGANQRRRRLFAGNYKAVLVPFERKHKIPSLTGALARHKLIPSGKITSFHGNRAVFAYFKYKNPPIKVVKMEMGLQSSYKLYGSYNKKIIQCINGVYVPIAKALGEALL